MTNLGPVNPAANPAINCSSLKPVDDGQTSVNDIVAAITQGTGVVSCRRRGARSRWTSTTR